ncbi:MAG: hypothetical protein FJ109_05830 [Deltaproteobacteria bacterium]|nr:hypothetical protein [Deltaproteobacteria bacterium]
MRLLRIGAVAAILVVLAACGRPVTVVTLERDGRQRGVTTERGGEVGTRIQILLPPGSSAEDLEVTYACLDRIAQPYLLSVDGTAAYRDAEPGLATFWLPECTGRMVVYNVVEPTGCRLLEQRQESLKEAVRRCEQQNHTADFAAEVATLGKVRSELTEERDKFATETASHLKELEEELALRESEKREFISVGTPAALAELKKTQELVRRLSAERLEYEKQSQAKLAEHDRNLFELTAQIDEAQEARDAPCRPLTEERDRTRAELRACGGPGPRILRLGAIIPGRNRETVWYRVEQPSKGGSASRLAHLGDFPRPENGDELYVQVVDRDPNVLPGPFGLNVTLTPGTEPNPAPLRPMFDPGRAAFSTEESPRPPPVVPRAPLVDVILPAERELHGGDVPSLSVTHPGINADGKPADVTLVSSVLPQVRSLYRFNLSAGMALSSLDEVKYSKKTQFADDPATADTNEAVYQTMKSGNTFQVQPLLAFTVYWLPMDIQEPVSWRDLLPSPTIGFGLLSPLDNLYLGFSHEFVRNLQFVWGLHLGKVTHLLDEEADALELRIPDAPKTVEAIQAGFFGSIQFNFNFFAKLLGK